MALSLLMNFPRIKSIIEDQQSFLATISKQYELTLAADCSLLNFELSPDGSMIRKKGLISTEDTSAP